MPYPRLLCTAALLLAACSEQASKYNGTPNVPETNVTELTPAEQVPPAVAAPSPTPGAPSPTGETGSGDGSQIRLLPLEADDAKGLEGELACSFSADGEKNSILLGRADVGAGARAFAVVRNAGVRESLSSADAGGFSAMARGVTFGGKGLTVRITRKARIETGAESSAHRAVLLVQRADGAERRFEGLWSCGP